MIPDFHQPAIDRALGIWCDRPVEALNVRVVVHKTAYVMRVTGGADQRSDPARQIAYAVRRSCSGHTPSKASGVGALTDVIRGEGFPLKSAVV
jgi:hypothetical protein